MDSLLATYILNAIFSAIPAVGFAMVFNVPRNALVYCAIGGAVGYTTRYALMHLNMPIELATFLASTLIGVIALYWSRKYIVPRPVYTIASIIPLLPGTYAFTAIINLLQMNAQGVSPELITMFIDNGLKAVIILSGIGFGLAIPSLVFMRYNRPII
ncbi:hypothetical protein CRV01_12300 [Arcobacter sp. CECT 8983]|uniref:threonine/serine exporter family protein n=1 Tax=Arcobacter sp. CECT 8983 TaxID=2044508 RepID=UPI00100B4877|nr:threonine/serine exporter family protein [Arcobacter sp. CECT 8983]RXJ88523.1 hypothetical protein CRV01_12300 [Arcobacter sp. CECT 8983]